MPPTKALCQPVMMDAGQDACSSNTCLASLCQSDESDDEKGDSDYDYAIAASSSSTPQKRPIVAAAADSRSAVVDPARDRALEGGYVEKRTPILKFGWQWTQSFLMVYLALFGLPEDPEATVETWTADQKLKVDVEVSFTEAILRFESCVSDYCEPTVQFGVAHYQEFITIHANVVPSTIRRVPDTPPGVRIYEFEAIQPSMVTRRVRMIL